MKQMVIACLLLTGCGHKEAETVHQLQLRLDALEARERRDSETITNLVHDVIEATAADYKTSEQILQLWEYIEAHDSK